MRTLNKVIVVLCFLGTILHLLKIYKENYQDYEAIVVEIVKQKKLLERIKNYIEFMYKNSSYIKHENSYIYTIRPP